MRKYWLLESGPGLSAALTWMPILDYLRKLRLDGDVFAMGQKAGIMA
jgi:hypothetical protein